MFIISPVDLADNNSTMHKCSYKYWSSWILFKNCLNFHQHCNRFKFNFWVDTFLAKEDNIHGLQFSSNFTRDLFSDGDTIHARQALLFVYHGRGTDIRAALNCSDHCHRLLNVMLIVDSYHNSWSIKIQFSPAYFCVR